MLKLENVSFKYGKNKILNEINLDKSENEIIALWGRNGIGKTTFMKLLSGHEKPTEGQLTIFGKEPHDNLKAIQKICYMQEDHPFNKVWTIKELMKVAEKFYPNWDSKSAQKFIEEFGLPFNQKISSFSKGMKTAAQITVGLSSFSNITILDEPTNGLDAGARKLFYRLLKENFDEKPRLLIISSHHIEEIHPFSDSLLVVHNGELIIDESMDATRERGIWLTGDPTNIQEFMADNLVLEKSELGGKVRVMANLPYTQNVISKAVKFGVHIEPTEVQEYLLNMTKQINVGSENV